MAGGSEHSIDSVKKPDGEQYEERLGSQSGAGGMESQSSLSRHKQAKLNRTYLVNLIEEQGYRCRLSGLELTPDTAALDHIIPVAKGGEHVAENVAWVHEEINRMKGQLSVDEFVSLCRKVVQYTR